MKNIVLAGFMGTGKTRVSKILAQRLKRQRLCLDDMIALKAGKPISRIFEEDGEEYFRRLESEAVAAAAKEKSVIIDAGGGVVIGAANVKSLKESGIIFCLTAKPEAILERTKGHRHRPLLNHSNPLERIRELLQDRHKYYERADYSIDTSDTTPDEVADRIIGIVSAYG